MSSLVGNQFALPHEAESLTLFLVEQGSMVDAIGLYQEEAGVSRDDARREVEQLARCHGIRSGTRRRVEFLALAFMLLSLALAFALH